MSFSFFCEKYVLRDCCLFKLILFDLISYRTLRRGRFQQYLQAPFAPIYFCAKKLQSQTVTREKLAKQKLYIPNTIMDMVWMTQNFHAVIKFCFGPKAHSTVFLCEWADHMFEDMDTPSSESFRANATITSTPKANRREWKHERFPSPNMIRRSDYPQHREEERRTTRHRNRSS